MTMTIFNQYTGILKMPDAIQETEKCLVLPKLKKN